MAFVNNTPFVKLLFPFIAGILFANLYENLSKYSVLLLCVCVFFLILFYFIKKLKNHFGFQILILIIFFVLGIFFTYNYNPRHHNNNLQKAGINGVYLIRVDEIPQIKARSIKFNAFVIYKLQDSNKNLININEKVVCYKQNRGLLPKPGDLLLVKCLFNKINEPENLYQFNYKKFLERQGIYYMSFLNENSININGNNANAIEILSYKGVVFLKKIFDHYIKDTVSRGVTEALIFGYKDDLPKDLIESYSKTGTLHVLAVSGMHVALVFLLLSKILWFFDLKKYGKKIKPILIILSVWIYCIITGLSPSVIRAGVMISLVVTGKMLNRTINIYNIIFASAFIILLINPLWIYNVGFQLSFAAVIGIVFLQEYIKKLWKPGNKITNAIWEIIVISISAQIAAFALCLYYFNQFPNYFILSNLIIIPLTTAIIYVGTLLVVFSKISSVAGFLSAIVTFLVKLTNYCVVKIENLPFSFIDGVKISALQTFFIYVVIASMIFWLIKNNRKAFMIMILFSILIFSFQLYDKLKLQTEKSVVIFNIPNNNAILFSNGKKSVVITDKNLNENLLFYIRGYLIEKRIFPISKLISFDSLKNYKYEDSEMDLSIINSIVIFRNYKIKFCNDISLNSYVNLNYVIPTNELLKYDIKEIYDKNMIIGHSKDKRLQKKIEKKISLCQNNAIKSFNTNIFKVINIP